jgi:HEAT repeat protein
MLFSALALLLCQEPSLRWSRDVDELYWQALHQLEVEERAEDAAATLASLLDEPSVQQFRGQTGYLLAQQYRALRAAGLMEEAEALLPSIRRDVANTDMAQLAESVITLANRTHPGQDGANEELLELLLSAANRDPDYLRSVISGYGERILPELLRIFDRPREYFLDGKEDPRRSGAFQSLWREAWRIGSAKFLEPMASRVVLRGPDYFALIPFSFFLPEDGLNEAQQSFLIRLSEDPRHEISRPVLMEMLPLIADTKVQSRVIEILQSGSERGVELLDALIGGRVVRSEVRFPVVRAALESENEPVRATAYELILSRREAYALHYLAEKKDDSVARINLLHLFATEPSKFGGGPGGRDFYGGFPKRLWDQIPQRRNERSFTLPGSSGTGNAGLVDWESWFDSQASSEDPEVLDWVLACAIAAENEKVVHGLLESGVRPEDLAFQIINKVFREDLRVLTLLLDSVDNTEQGKWVWTRHCVNNRVLLGLLTPDQLARFGEMFPIGISGSLTSIGAQSEATAERDDAWRQRSLAIVKHPTMRMDLKASAARSLLEAAVVGPETYEVLMELAALREQLPASKRRDFLDGIVINRLRSTLDRAVPISTLAWNKGVFPWLVALMDAPPSASHSERQLLEAALKYCNRSSIEGDELFYTVLNDPAWSESMIRERSGWPFVGALMDGELFKALLTMLAQQELAMQWRPWFEVKLPSEVPYISEEAVEVGLTSSDASLRQSIWIGLCSSQSGVQVEFSDRIAAQLAQDLLDPLLAADAFGYFLIKEDDQAGLVEAASSVWALGDLSNRSKFVKRLGEKYIERFVPILLEAQLHPDPKISQAAEVALDRYERVRDTQRSWAAWERQGRDGSPIDALVAKTVAEKSKTVRLAAIQSLGTLEAKEALPFLVELLEDGDQEIVAAAQAALARIHAAAEGSDE